MEISKETLYWEKQVQDILFAMQSSSLSRMITPVHGRRLVGYERDLSGYSKKHPDYSEFT
jgi:hypothetical protein